MIEPYTYDANKKHAVVQVQNTGNLIQGAASLTYNAFNKVATVVQGTNTLTITYGPDRQRTKTVLVNGSNTTTTLYADNYEQRTVNGTTTTYHYVASPDGLAAVYVKSGSTATAYYIETDHLGSIIRAYDYIGNVKFSAAYDAWGNQTVSTNAIGLTRGYTGHEHWPQFGLIDMNGRFYDPLLGRFLSPDPYVQAPDNPQSYNRYAYCFNNPLKYTDPSGNVSEFVAFLIFNTISYGLWKGVEASSKDQNFWKGFGQGAAIGGLTTIASYGISKYINSVLSPNPATTAGTGPATVSSLEPATTTNQVNIGGARPLMEEGGICEELISMPRAELQSFGFDGSIMLEEVTITAKAGSYAAAQQNIMNQINGIFNINAAVTYLNAHALDVSTGQCSRYVQDAIKAGGINTPNYYLAGGSYGKSLQEWGFSLTTKSLDGYIPVKGDVAVIQGYPGGTMCTNGVCGHIQMYNGDIWISDFKQSGFWPGPGYRKYTPNFEIYRWK